MSSGKPQTSGQLPTGAGAGAGYLGADLSGWGRDFD